MNNAEKQRILAAYERAGLVAALASRGFYVIGEVWRDRICGQPVRPGEVVEDSLFPDDDQPRPARRDRDPVAEGAAKGDLRGVGRLSGGTAGRPRR